MIRVFLDPRLYAVPGAAKMVPMPHVMDDMDPMHAPVEEPIYAPVHEPLHSPIPEAVPAYDPGQQPLAPNPYEAQPVYGSSQGTQSYPQTGAYDPNNYVHYSSTGEVYGSQPMQGGVTATANPYQTGYAQAETGYAGQAYAGTGALDLNHNPYATGEVQAGSLDNSPTLAHNPYAPPHS